MADVNKLPDAVETPERAADFALWNLGFRPFYLAASGYAVVSILIWAAQFSGWLPHPFLASSIWHAHEMLFGFVLPVIVGFLLTAGQAWTGRKTLHGLSLMALVMVWLCARVLVMTPWVWASALANAAFPWMAAAALAGPFIRSGVQRHYFFLVLLIALGVITLGVHASRLASFGFAGRLGMQLALDIVLFIMVVMAGRVTPPFTVNGVPGTKPRRLPWLERVAPGLIVVVLLADILSLQGAAMLVLLALATLAHAHVDAASFSARHSCLIAAVVCRFWPVCRALLASVEPRTCGWASGLKAHNVNRSVHHSCRPSLRIASG